MDQQHTLPAQQAMRTRAVTAAAVGTALEWFDFTLYGALAATVLPKLFFPSMDSTSALLASLATFGVGLAARPLGAIICGYLGDKLGRRNLMLGTVTVMGVCSMLMGLLPTYACFASCRVSRWAANRPARSSWQSSTRAPIAAANIPAFSGCARRSVKSWRTVCCWRFHRQCRRRHSRTTAGAFHSY
jgi:MFS family permease